MTIQVARVDSVIYVVRQMSASHGMQAIEIVWETTTITAAAAAIRWHDSLFCGDGWMVVGVFQ